MVKAALGLTLGEAENAFARSMVNDGVLDDEDVEVVLEEKRQTIRKSGLLEFVTVGVVFDDVGGLQNLKGWLAKRNDSWLRDAAAYGLIVVQGWGSVGKMEVETPAMIRYGQMTNDELFVTAAAAGRGVTVTNSSETEDLVMLKHFGPGNPDAAQFIK